MVLYTLHTILRYRSAAVCILRFKCQFAIRRKGVGTTGIESLLEFSFKYLPVGNAYAEYLVKLVKNSTSESRAYFETMLLKLRARTSLNAWSVGCDDFKLIRSMLGHSKPRRRAVRAAIYDSSHLVSVIYLLGIAGNFPF